MEKYILRRLAGIIPLLFGISLLSFAVINLAPGKPVALENSLNPRVSARALERLEKLYELDKPVYERYWHWLKRTAVLDFGRSFSDNRPVIEKIAERLPVTITINLLSLFLIFAAAIPLGVRCALRPDGMLDKVMTAAMFFLFAIPTFWLALLLMNFFGINLRWLPVSGITSLNYEYLSPVEKVIDLLRHLLLPVTVSSLGGIASMARYMRSSMIEALAQPYIRMARAKGLTERSVLYKHAFRNAVMPLVTIMGLSLPGLVGGSVIFESVFAIPGAGRLFYEAVMMRDYPLIMAEVVIVSVLTMTANLLADVSYAWIDPRLRDKR
ncbi:MAG: ABC transporter permease [Candidatus Omnitrophota bacterium]|jgi:peptide/nickel transport system permease protein